ncbi:hypothetical protein CCP2SC5_50076 [Azospirillaceae bacterium]
MKLVCDVADMRLRIAKEFIDSDIWDVKYVRGGMIDINFIAQYLILKHSCEYPEILVTNTSDAIVNMSKCGILDEKSSMELVFALKLWRRIQGYLRLTFEKKIIINSVPNESIRCAISRIVFPEEKHTVEWNSIEEKVRSIENNVYAYFRTIIENPTEIVSCKNNHIRNVK